MTKEEEFQKIAEQLNKLECPSFALWYLLPEFQKIISRQMAKETCDNDVYKLLAHWKYSELKKAAAEIREIVANELW